MKQWQGYIIMGLVYADIAQGAGSDATAVVAFICAGLCAWLAICERVT